MTSSVSFTALCGDDIFSHTIYDSCYLLEVSERMSILAYRAATEMLRVGDSFGALLEEDAKSELFGYLTRYTEQPLLLHTKLGLAVIMTSPHFPNKVCLAMFPHLPEEAIVSAIGCGELAHFIPLGSWQPKTENPVRDQRSIRLLRQLHAQLQRCFSAPLSMPAEDGKSREQLVELVRDIAYYVGCPVTVCENALTAVGEIDVDLVRIALLALLMHCRRVAPKREATVWLGDKSMYPTVSVTYEIAREDVDEAAAELRGLSALLARVGSGFDVFYEENLAVFRFRVARREV